MKYLILLFFIFIKLPDASGQMEFVKHYEDSSYSLAYPHHVTDNEGNTYIVALRDVFYNNNEGLCRGGSKPSYPLVLYKINSSGSVVWNKMLHHDVRYPSHIFLRDSTLFVFYATSGGCVQRMRNSDATIDGWGDYVDGGMLVNARNGAEIKNVYFSYVEIDSGKTWFESYDCKDHNFIGVFMHRDNSISYINKLINRNCTKPTMQIIERSSILNYISSDTGTSIPDDLFSVFYDEQLSEYIITDTVSVGIYNRQLQLVRKLVLPVDVKPTNQYYRIVFNERYYVINYGKGHGKIETNVTAIFTKQGRLVSIKESPNYQAMTISNTNRIYAVSGLYINDLNSSITKPLTLTCMNVRQRKLSQRKIGRPFVRASDISLTNNNELVITGESSTTYDTVLPQTPDGIYYYKEKLRK